MKKLGNISRRLSIWALVLAIAALCFFIAFVPYASSAKADDDSVVYVEPPEAAVTYVIGDETVEGVYAVNEDGTEYHYRAIEAGYNAAVDKAKELQRAKSAGTLEDENQNVNVKVVLAKNWIAAITESSNGVPVFGEGSGFLLGRIFVPTDAHIIFDLNGCVVNRGLVSKIENYYNELTATAYSDGNVFYVQGELMVADSHGDANNEISFNYGYNSISVYGGVITGGAAGSGGGIYVADYGKLSIYGGTVYNNYALSTGGGIALMAFTEFHMYYGNIINNRSNRHGGGISADTCIITIDNGNIYYNYAVDSGGGIYSYGDYYFDSDSGLELCTFEINYVEIMYNKAKNKAGGLYFGDFEVYMSGGVIKENSSGVYGTGQNISTLYLQGSVQIANNESNNLVLENGSRICLSDAFNSDAEIYLSNAEITIVDYEKYNLDEDGLLINPENYFQLDRNLSNDGYHLLRDNYSYILSQYYVKWSLHETTTVNNVVEFGDDDIVETFDNPFMIEFIIADYNADNEYRTGISGIVYTLDSNGQEKIVTEKSVKAVITHPNYPGSYNYAPVKNSFGYIVPSANYTAKITAVDNTFVISINAKAKSVNDDDISVSYDLNTDNTVFQFGITVEGVFGQKRLTIADLFGDSVEVKDGATTLTRDIDYVLKIWDENGQVSEEENYLLIEGANCYTDTKKIAFNVTPNEDASYNFVEWQYNGSKISDNGKIIYTGNDLSQSIRMKFEVDGVEVAGAPDYNVYGYANSNGTYRQSDKGLRYKLYRVSDSGVKETVTEIVNVGKYRIEFDLNGSTPNVETINIIDDSNAVIDFTVVPKEIDFTNVQFDNGAGNPEDTELAEGIAVALKSDPDQKIDFLQIGDSFVVNGTKYTVDGENVGNHYVYSYGEELVLVIVNDGSATFVIDGVDIAREVANGTCSINLSHQGDVINASGSEITTYITLTFINYSDPNYNEHNSRGGVTYTNNSITFEYTWNIVTACNSVVDYANNAYKPTTDDLVDGKFNIEYGNSIILPYARYGNNVVVEITKDGGETSKFVLSHSGSAILLYEYDDTAASDLGALIDSDFDTYVSDILRMGGKGDYTLTLTTATYKDLTTGIVYMSVPDVFKFNVSEMRIREENMQLIIANTPMFTGSQLKPVFGLYVNGVLCVEGLDYTVEWGENVSAGADAGEYTITGIGVYAGTVTGTFDIAAATNNEITSLVMPGWLFGTYDSDINIIIATSVFGIDTATYKIEKYVAGDSELEPVKGLENSFKVENGKIVDPDGTITKSIAALSVGKYKLTVTVPKTDDYNKAEKSIDVSVSATTYSVPTLVYVTSGAGKNDTYNNGNELSIIIDNMLTVGMDITIDERIERVGNVLYATNAGEYEISFTLTESEHTAWNDGEEGDTRTLVWKIDKQKVAVPDYGEDTFMYNGTERVYMPKGFDENLMTISGNTATKAGKYTVFISLKDTDNYEWADAEYANMPSITHSFTVESSAKIFIIVMCILAAIAVLIAIVILTQYLVHKQRLKVFAMADENAKANNAGGND